MESQGLKANINSLNPPESPLILIEIFHPEITDGLYLVNDRKMVHSNGKDYLPVNLTIQKPSDVENELPRLSIAISNSSKELLYWIDRSTGGRDARFVFKIIRRSVPDLVEQRIPTKLTNLDYNIRSINIDLVVQDNLNKVGTRFAYTQFRSPGLF